MKRFSFGRKAETKQDDPIDGLLGPDELERLLNSAATAADIASRDASRRIEEIEDDAARSENERRLGRLNEQVGDRYGKALDLLLLLRRNRRSDEDTRRKIENQILECTAEIRAAARAMDQLPVEV